MGAMGVACVTYNLALSQAELSAYTYKCDAFAKSRFGLHQRQCSTLTLLRINLGRLCQTDPQQRGPVIDDNSPLR